MLRFVLCSIISFNSPADSVLVCGGTMSYAFHTHVCAGLALCSRNPYKTDSLTARRRGFRPCYTCYPRQVKKR